VRQIENLTTFPLAYHPRRLAVETKLVSGFHMMKNGPFQVQFDSRIMVDAAFFREMKPKLLSTQN
jgi:predicted metalloprotease